MILSFHPCFDTDIQIILGDRSLDDGILQSIQEADAILLPQACPQNLYGICTVSDVPVFPNYEARISYPGKVGQAGMFTDLGLPHPKTSSWETVEAFKRAFSDLEAVIRGVPVLIKEDKSHEAEGVFLIENENALRQALDHLALRESSGLSGFVLQEYIPCSGNVLRAVIIGKRIITYWKRPDKPGQEITTISRGAVIDHDWRPDLQEKGKKETLALAKGTGINLAAIDFVFPMAQNDPVPLFLEINYYFGRRGLGGTENYYHLLHEAIQNWLREKGLPPGSVRLV